MVRWKAHRQGYPAHVVLAVGHVMRPRKAGLKFGRSMRPVRLPAKNFRRAEAAREGTEASGTRRGSYLRQFRR